VLGVSTRGAGIAGVACFVLVVAGGLADPLWEWPDTGATASEVAAYVAEHHDRTLVALFLYSLAFGLFFPFAAGVWARLRAFEPEPGVLAATFALAAAAMATLILAGFVPAAVLAYRAPSEVAAVQLRDLSFGILAASGIPTAAALGAYAVAVMRTRCLSIASAVAAAIGAVAHVAIAATFLFESGFLSLEGAGIIVVPVTMFVWILLAGVALIRRA